MRSKGYDPYKTLLRQQDQTDCGIACLLSIISHYGGANTLENLRRLSGTTTTGTTLLGLYQAARQTGFDAEGCEADISILKDYPDPVILHVLLDQQLQHYVVCFGAAKKDGEPKFIIGDPARGIIYLTPGELEKVWVSKACLTLKPNANFKKATAINKQKKQWIFNLVKEDFPVLAIAAAIGITIAVLGLVMALFSQRLIDDILPKKDVTRLNLGIALVFLLLLTKEGLSFLRQTFLLRQSSDFNTRLIDHFYTHLLQLPKPFFDTRKIGELTARLNDTARIQRVISQLAGNVIIDALVTVVTLVFLFTYSWKIGAASLIAAPVYFVLIYRHNKSIIKSQRNLMSNYAQSEANYISTLQGIDPIKNYNKQALFAATNKNIYQRFQQAVVHLGKIQIRLSFLASSFGILFLVSVLLYAGYSVMNGQLKTGELMAMLSMCATLLPGIANLALVSIPVNEAKIAFDRMFEFTGTEPEKEEDENTPLPFESLTVQNLSFRFAGRSPLIKNVSFKVQKGEIIALMGENGTGKSTLSRLLQQDYLPESGSILLNGNMKAQQLSLQAWRRAISAVPQQVHIFNGTVLENIAFDDAVNRTREVLQFLHQYGFAPFMDSLPQSYATLVGEEGINLSGGQKQIIALARALYHKPQLLILDEATAAMDRRSEQFVLGLLKQVKKDLAIVFITHRLHVLKLFCDRIYILEDGVVKQSGNHHELLKTENLYSLYWKDFSEIGSAKHISPV